MAKQLLREWISLGTTKELVKESREANGGKIILSGKLQMFEQDNQNGRTYPRNILKREFDNYMKAVRENRAVGQLDHPESSVVALKEAAIIVRDMWWEDPCWMGRVEVLTTPNGKILESLLDDGVNFGISSRGIGSVTNNGHKKIVNDDYQIICFDIVAEPSTPGAYLSEGKEIDFDPKQIFTKADRIHRVLNSILKR